MHGVNQRQLPLIVIGPRYKDTAKLDKGVYDCPLYKKKSNLDFFSKHDITDNLK